MSSKLTLRTLALTGILAVSGLPALAAEMSPATPAPGAAVQSNVKGDVKTDAKIIPGNKKNEKTLHKDTKAKDSKDKRSELKTNKQTAKLPAASAPVSPAPAANSNSAVGTSVQH